MYINDDKPALRQESGTWLAYGTPWSEKYDLSSPAGVPVGGIAFLKRGEKNSIRPLTAEAAVLLIMSQSLWKLKREMMDRQLSIVDALLRCVPVWELTCRNDDAAACMSRDAMTAAGGAAIT